MSSISGAAHIKRRQEFYDQYGFEWPGTLNEPTDILEAIPVQHEEFENIRLATRSIKEIYKYVLRHIPHIPEEELVRIGIPRKVVVASRCKSGVDDLALSRLDLIISEDDIKLLECNFDAPGLIVETFEINRLVCKQLHQSNPNELGEAALRKCYLRNIEKACRHIGKPKDRCEIAVCCRGEYSRDVEAAKYVTNLLREQLPGVRYVTIEECVINELGLHDANAKRIDALILMYPFGEITHWKFGRNVVADTESSSDRLAALYAQRKLVTINSPMGSILENKAIQALIWKMYEENIGFPGRIRENIGRYMLPTSFDFTRFGGRYVAKPVSGRGGSSIKVFENSNIIERARTLDLERDALVFQQYYPAPEKLTMTEYGMRRLRFIASVWAIDESEIGLCYRAGEGLTDAAWWIVPVFFS